MPYTVHTLDGQAHTYPDHCHRYLDGEGSGALYIHDLSDGGHLIDGNVVAAYPAGQWTHYHVEPAPYETDTQAREDTVEARQKVEGRLTVSVEEKDKWQASFQRYLDVGRKAAEAQ